MSCLLRPFASIVDVEEVKTFLYDEDYPVGKEWLQECLVNLSPVGDHLVIAYKRNMVILKSKWDSQEDVKTKYQATELLTLSLEEEDEFITAVLCLPLYAHSKSFQCSPDWTCIVVGFSSGYVRFYTETGNLLVEELIHNECVINLKCQAYESSRSSDLQEQAEEVYVIYKSVLCVLGGFGLFQTLRACRSQVARAKANCGDVVRAPPLIYKKWGFQDQASISDCEVAGQVSPNTFNHLMTTSLCQDFGSFYRSGAPQMSLVLAVGRKPYVGFHYAMEGGAPPPFRDMAKAVASKLKSALGQAVPGWLSGGRKGNGGERSGGERRKEKMLLEPLEPMLCRFGLCDILRFGDRIVMSPNKLLSAVSDSLGRVLLLDNQKGIAIRMWKGYRNAQCGWLEVREDAVKGSRSRTALFLVIYSPNMNCIDVWALQHGSRVASFSAEDTKNGKLLYIGHGFMGLNNVSLQEGNKSQYPVVFVDPNGCLKEVLVPFFHLALSAKDSKRTRDIHQLKELKKSLKAGLARDHDEEVQAMVTQLHTIEIQIQAIEMLASSRYSSPKALQVACKVCIGKLSIQDAMDPSGRSLLHLCEQLQRLIGFYTSVLEQHQKHQKPSQQCTVGAQILSTLLHAPEQEVNNLVDLIDVVERVRGRPRPEVRVAFRADGGSAFVDFMSCFDIDSQMIHLKRNICEEKLRCISELIYQGWLYSDTAVEVWKEWAKQSFIEPLELIRLALLFWLQKQGGSNLGAEMLRFAALLKAVCSLADINVICAEYNELSSWWREVRRVLMDSNNPFMALTGAIICRAVALSLEKDKETQNILTCTVSDRDNGNSAYADDETHTSVSEWENVSRDTCQWTLLIGQLEDLALLDTVLKQKPWAEEEMTVDANTEKLHMCRLPYKKLSVSLSEILKKGKGSVSELVGRWLSCAGLEPKYLIASSDVEFDSMELHDANTGKRHSSRHQLLSTGVAEGEKMDVEEGAEASVANRRHVHILDLLALLKHRFPYSLSSSVLLANLCWEYMFSWHNSPDKLEALEAAVLCLQAVPSPHMKHGLCSLVWSTHLKHRFEGAANLLQKTGRVPKERLCQLELGISDLQLPSFLNTCHIFLETFMDATVASGESQPLSLLRCEELWDCETALPRPLAEVALTQPPVSAALLHLHCQLALALHMMVFFNIRLAHPLAALFDNMSLAALFSELSPAAAATVEVPCHKPDPKLQSSRTQFLLRVVRAAVHTVRRVECRGLGLDAEQCKQWMSKCLLMADIWGVSGDILRRQQVCELYSNGFDPLAQEAISAVRETTELASQLLVIVGQRVKQLVESSGNFQEWVSNMNPMLYRWLRSLSEGASPCFLWSSEDTGQLLAQVVQYLPEDTNEYQLALHMLDLMSSVADD